VNRSRLVLFLLLFLPLSLRGERVVTLGAPVTEIVFALGAGDSVVAVDQSSTHPEAAAALPQVGYVRMVSAEGILSVEPERILAADTLGPPAAVEQLKSSGIPLLLVPNPHDAATLREAILLLGRELGREKPAQALVESIEADLAQARARWAGRERPRVVFLMGNSGSAMAAGAGTQADGIITLAGGENLFAGYQGYKPVSEEALLGNAPDIVLVGAFRPTSAPDPRDVLRGLGLVNLAESGDIEIRALDAGDYLAFGPRTGKAALRLSELLAANGGEVAGDE